MKSFLFIQRVTKRFWSANRAIVYVARYFNLYKKWKYKRYVKMKNVL